MAAQWAAPPRPASAAVIQPAGSIMLVTARVGRRWVFGSTVVRDHRPTGRIKVVELAVTDGPKKSPNRETDQDETQGDQQENDGHAGQATLGAPTAWAGLVERVRRSAFKTTKRELADMPMAASHGGIHPSAAMGRATKLYNVAHARF